MCLEFVDSFGLCNQFGEFTAMWWNKMTGSGSGQIREPPRFFGLYFSQLCVPDRATTMVPALCGQGRKTPEIKFLRRRFIAKRASTICGAALQNPDGQQLRTRQGRLLRRSFRAA